MNDIKLYYNIGDIVSTIQIEDMTKFLKEFGYEAFKSAVFYGAFSELSMAYIHPCEEMKSTDNFQDIQKAFINAYV